MTSKGYDFRTGIEGGEHWLGVTHLIFADKYCLMTENKAMLTDSVGLDVPNETSECGYEIGDVLLKEQRHPREEEARQIQACRRHTAESWSSTKKRRRGSV